MIIWTADHFVLAGSSILQKVTKFISSPEKGKFTL